MSTGGAARPGLKVGYTCKAVAADHPTVGTQMRWIAALAADPRVEAVHVFTPERGAGEVPANVTVHVLPPGRWWRKALAFVTATARREMATLDFFLVVQGGPYPALLLPWKARTRRTLAHWKAQPHASPRMRFYARWCDDVIFTPTAGSFPHQPEKVRVIGHGIDTNLFRPGTDPPDRDLAVITRIARIKHLDDVIRAVAAASGRPQVDIIGPTRPPDVDYEHELRALAASLGVADQVRFLGARTHHEVAAALPRYRAVLNFSATAFDKAVGEAMACGVPVITTNPCAVEVLPAPWRDQCTAPAGDIPALAACIDTVRAWNPATRADAAAALRAAVERDHSLASLFGKIIAEVAPAVASGANR